MNPHFKALEAAYQLHVYFCFKTHYLKPLLVTPEAQLLVEPILLDVCNREDYHLLETDVSRDSLRLSLSLRPDQKVAHAAKMLKGNLDRAFALSLPAELRRNWVRKPWARGYFARSSGKINLEVARQYVASQGAHHGYRGDWTGALNYRNPAFKSPAFTLAHSLTILDYHVVLVTQGRLSVFDEEIAPRLFEYVTIIGEKRGFAVERIGILPDHLHLIFEARPDVSAAECVRSLMENTCYWMEKRYRGVLKETGAWNVWQPSYYAGTVGKYSTAQVKRFLSP